MKWKNDNRIRVFFRKNIFSSVLASLVLVMIICGCVPQRIPSYALETLEPPMETELNTLPGVSMEVTSRHQTYMTVAILWESGEHGTLTAGESFWLDYRYDGLWYSVPLAEGQALAFTDIAYGIKPAQPRDIEVFFGTLYGGLPPGEYRVVKPVSCRGGGAEGQYYLSAGFTVE